MLLLVESRAARFHVRPSTTSTVNVAELRATNCHKHEQMYSCYTRCLQLACCLAVKFYKNNECEMSYFPTEAMDLVKVVSILQRFILQI